MKIRSLKEIVNAQDWRLRVDQDADLAWPALLCKLDREKPGYDA